MSNEAIALSRKTAQRLLDSLKPETEAMEVPTPRRSSIDVHWVKISSGTPDGHGYYSGHWYTVDSSAGAITFVERGAVLIVPVGATPPATGTYYLGRVAGSRDGVAVFAVAPVDTSGSAFTLTLVDSTDLSYDSGTNTLNIPEASATREGTVTTGSQTLAGTKTLGSSFAWQVNATSDTIILDQNGFRMQSKSNGSNVAVGRLSAYQAVLFAKRYGTTYNATLSLIVNPQTGVATLAASGNDDSGTPTVGAFAVGSDVGVTITDAAGTFVGGLRVA